LNSDLKTLVECVITENGLNVFCRINPNLGIQQSETDYVSYPL